MRLVTTILAVLLLAGCATVPNETAVPPRAGQTEQSTEPPAQQSARATATHAKRWVTVAKLSGTADKRGQSFHLGDGDKRLSYTVKDTSGFGAVMVAIYIVPKGESLEKSGGFPEVTVSEAGSDSTQLAQEAGDYYLDVNAANAGWSVKIQEKK
jgi:uncharacterized protein YceK